MKFHEFIKTSFRVDRNRLADHLGVEPHEAMLGNEAVLYLKNLFIEVHGDGYLLIIGNQQWISKNLGELEYRLYDWAKGEGYFDDKEELLHEEARDWMDKHNNFGLKPMSLDELLCEAYNKEIISEELYEEGHAIVAKFYKL